MVLRCVSTALVCGLAWGLTSPASAQPHWPLVSGGAYHQRQPAHQPGNSNYGVACPAYQQPANCGQYPWYGSTWGVPTYNWGHFGARSGPTIKCHKAYYRDLLRWWQHRRY